MKSYLIRSAITFCLAAVSTAEQPSGDKIKELEEKMAALQREKAALAEQVAKSAPTPTGPSALFDGDGKIAPAIANAVLIIEGDQSVGTGFVAESGGKKYLYTAAHVFSGNTKLTVKNATGVNFKKFGALEAAEGADLIRMEILEDVKDSLVIAPADAGIQINTPIAALGNGGGTGVVAVEKGKILGISADSLEVDAGIIQGNSGGPVVDQATGKVLGLVTHLTSERKDLWSEGTRQAEVRRFACRVDKNWQWKTMKIGVFLADGKSLVAFDELTRLCFAVAHLEPLTNGMRLDTSVGQGSTVVEVLERNRDNEIVRSLFKMNVDLANRKSNLSEAELKKKFRSLISQIQGQAKRSSDSFAPQDFAWFHRKQSEVSVQARKDCLTALQADLDNLR
jgi:serine protease Do